MKWRLEFYNEKRGILARYGIEAPLPAAAVRLGRNAVLADHPSAPARGRLSLFERAERAGGHETAAGGCSTGSGTTASKTPVRSMGWSRSSTSNPSAIKTRL
jgi:hypothetical protein